MFGAPLRFGRAPRSALARKQQKLLIKLTKSFPSANGPTIIESSLFSVEGKCTFHVATLNSKSACLASALASPT
jgi:hypothetical protein